MSKTSVVCWILNTCENEILKQFNHKTKMLIKNWQYFAMHLSVPIKSCILPGVAWDKLLSLNIFLILRYFCYLGNHPFTDVNYVCILRNLVKKEISLIKINIYYLKIYIQKKLSNIFQPIIFNPILPVESSTYLFFILFRVLNFLRILFLTRFGINNVNFS